MSDKKTLFSKRISESNERIYEISVPCAYGRKAFYRLAVFPLKEAAFLNACKKGMTINVSEFGDVIESGYISNTGSIAS